MTRQRTVTARKLGPLLFVLVLAATPLQAQTEAAGTVETPSTSTNERSAENPAASRQASPTGEPAPESTSQRSPFDYRSSEEISEDVPVSFPVDI